MPTPKLTPEIITAAIAGFESQKRRIDEQIAELRQMLQPGAVTPTAAAPAKAKRKLSAAGLKAIRDAVRKRWAAVNAAKAQTATTTAKPVQKKAAPEKRAAKRTPAAKKASNQKQIPAT